MKSAPIFSQRLLIVWVAAAILIFACSLLLMEHASREGHAGRQETTGANAFSRSAIGHAGVADILRRLGLPVQESESGSLAKLRTGGVLVLAEPRPFEGGDNLRELLEAKTVLLVLPKRRGQPSVTHPGWIEEASLVLPFEAAWALHMLVPDGAVEQCRGHARIHAPAQAQNHFFRADLGADIRHRLLDIIVHRPIPSAAADVMDEVADDF